MGRVPRSMGRVPRSMGRVARSMGYVLDPHICELFRASEQNEKSDRSTVRERFCGPYVFEGHDGPLRKKQEQWGSAGTVSRMTEPKVCVMATQNNRLNRLADDQKLIAGVKQYLAQYASLSVDGQNTTPTNIAALLQARVDALTAVTNAEAALLAARKVERDGRVKSSTFRSALVRLVVGMFQSSPDTLAAFGLSAPKAVTKSVATKANALAKSEATRKARHTMGKNQKAAIHGTVDATSNGAPVVTGTGAPKV